MIDAGLLLATGALNALGIHIAVLDESGAIVFVNEAWSRFARNNGATTAATFFVGTNYFAVCRDAVRCGDVTARLALSGFQEVLRLELAMPARVRRSTGGRALRVLNDQQLARGASSLPAR